MMWRTAVAKLLKDMNAFKGSKPIFDSLNMFIVKSICRDDVDNIKEYLTKKLKENNFEVIEDKEKIKDFVENIHNILKGDDIYLDFFGFDKMKESFINVGCECDYVIGKRKNIYVGITMYYDKKLKNPKFVEVIALNKDEL